MYNGEIHIAMDIQRVKNGKRMEQAIESYLEPVSYNAGGLQPGDYFDVDCSSPYPNSLEDSLKALEDMINICLKIDKSLNRADIDVILWLYIIDYYSGDEGVPVIVTSVDHPQGRPGLSYDLTLELSEDQTYWHEMPSPSTPDHSVLVKIAVEKINYV